MTEEEVIKEEPGVAEKELPKEKTAEELDKQANEQLMDEFYSYVQNTLVEEKKRLAAMKLRYEVAIEDFKKNNTMEKLWESFLKYNKRDYPTI